MSKAVWMRFAAYLIVGGVAATLLLLRTSAAGAKAKPLVSGEYRLSPAEAAKVRAELKPPSGFEPSKCRQHAASETLVCFHKPRSIAVSQAVTVTLISESGATVHHWERIAPPESTCGAARLMQLRRRTDPSELRLFPMDCYAGATLGPTRLLYAADSLVLADAKSVAGSTRGTRFQAGGTVLEVDVFGRLDRCPCRANDE